tara:strand:+ start:301 stop:480 length:180 start_codon:yes stop_codon:yes gene_type:complete
MTPRIINKEYTSYKTHNYCQSCEMWFRKEESLGKFCPDCGLRIRKKSKFYSKDKWKGAY